VTSEQIEAMKALGEKKERATEIRFLLLCSELTENPEDYTGSVR